MNLRGTLTDDVVEILEKVENQLSGPLNAVLATSMISHGVDVDRFN